MARTGEADHSPSMDDPVLGGKLYIGPVPDGRVDLFSERQCGVILDLSTLTP